MQFEDADDGDEGLRITTDEGVLVVQVSADRIVRTVFTREEVCTEPETNNPMIGLTGPSSGQ